MPSQRISDGHIRALLGPPHRPADHSRTAVCAALLTGALLAGWPRTSSAQEILIQIDGATGELLGPAANLGNLDADGIEDFILGAPGRAKVYVYSARTLEVLYDIDGPYSCCEGFGAAVDGVGDFDADAVPDFVVGDAQDSTVIHSSGAVHVFSGADGTELAVMYGNVYDEGLGRAVAGLGDIDGDGFADVGAASYFNHVRIYGGPDGHLIRSHFGPTITRPSISGVGDMDGDGHADYVIGWPQDNTIGDWAGRATVYSGIDGSVIHDVFGHTGNGTGIIGDHLGTSVAGLGDVDGDGIPDFAAGAPGVVCMGSCGAATQAMVRVYSGLDARVLHEWNGVDYTNRAWGGLFGFRIFGGGDLNGDGLGDILVAAPDDGWGSPGSLQAFSGKTGGVLWKVWGQGTGNLLRFGAILGDLDGDGLAEFAVGDDLAYIGGSYSGRVTIYRGFPADIVEHCFTAPNSLSRGIQLDSTGPIGIGNNALSLLATGAVAGQPALFFYGGLRPPMPFGDGWLCTAPPIFRLSPPGTVEPDGSIERALDFTQPPMSSGPGEILPGSTWSLQLFCRDPQGPGGSGFNLSDGLLITFPP